MTLNPLDFLILAIVGLCLIRSLFRGAVREVFSILSLVIAYIISAQYFQPFLKVLPSKLSGSPFGNLIAFAALFVCTAIVVNLIGWALHKLVGLIHLTLLDRIAGGILGLVKGSLVVCIVIVVLITFLPNKSSLVRNSSLSAHTIAIVDVVSAIFPKKLRSLYRGKRKELEREWKKSRPYGIKAEHLDKDAHADKVIEHALSAPPRKSFLTNPGF
jgi:membrane protein required for colicin V production